MDTSEFFERFGEYDVWLNFYNNHESITLEELYQHFKKRIEGEALDETNKTDTNN